MNNFTSKFKKLLTVLILLTSFLDVAIPVLADEVITSGQVLTNTGLGGAYLNSAVDATVTSNQTNANVLTPGSASYLQWRDLNVGAGQSLNYQFLTPGATSINTVVGPSMSQFAGALTSSGAAGCNVVIANPNGVLLLNGSYTNINGNFDLSTQNINWQVVNGAIRDFTAGAYGPGKIQIGQGDMNNAAVLRVAGDLNIIAPAGVLVDAADILAGTSAGSTGGKNIRLITSDGVNYLAVAKADGGSYGSASVAAGNNVLNSNTEGKAILVKNSALAVKDNDNGNIYFITKGANADVAVVNSAIAGVMKLNVAGNADFKLIGNLDIADSHVAGNLTTETMTGLNGTSTPLTLKNNKSNTYTTTQTLNEYLLTNDYSSQVPVYSKRWVSKWWGGYWETYQSGTETKVTTSDIKQFYLDKYGKTLSNNEADSILDHDLGRTYSASSSTFNVATNTSVSGKGSVSISNTVVGGDVTVNGGDVKINGLTSKSLDSKSTGGTAVAYTQNDTGSFSASRTVSTWEGTHKEIYVNGKWQDATLHKWVLFDGVFGDYWVYGNNQHIGAWFGPDSRTVNTTFVANTTPTQINLDSNYSTSSLASTGITDLTGITTTGGDLKVKAVDTFTMNGTNTVNGNVDVLAYHNLTVNGLTTKAAGAKNGDVKLETFNVVSVNGSDVAGNLSAESKLTNRIATNSETGVTTQRIYRDAIDVTSTKVGETLTAKGWNIKVADSSAKNMDLTAITDKTITTTGSTSNIQTYQGYIDLNNASSTDNTAVSNLTADDKITLRGGSSFGNVKAFAADIDIKEASSVRGGKLQSVKDISIKDNSIVQNTEVAAGRDLAMSNGGSILNYVYPTKLVTVGRDMTMTSGAKFVNTTANVTGKMSATNSSIIGSTVNADTIKVDGSAANKEGYTLNSATLKAVNGVTIDNVDAGGTLVASTSKTGAIHLGNVTGNAKATLTANANTSSSKVEIINSKLGKTTANAYHNVIITGSELGDTIANSTQGNVNISKGSYATSKLASLDAKGVNVSIYDTTITGDAKLKATTNEVAIYNSTLGSISDANGSYITVDNSTVNGNSNLTATNQGLRIRNHSNLKGTNVLKSYGNDVTITASELGTTKVGTNAGLNISEQSKIASLDADTNFGISINNSEVTGKADLNTLTGGIWIQNGSKIGSLDALAKNTIYIDHSQVVGNSNMASTNGGITIQNNSKLGNTVANSKKGQLYVDNSTVGNIAANANDIYVQNSTLGDVSLKSNNGITLYGPVTVGNSVYSKETKVTGLDAGSYINMYDTTTVNGNLVANAGTDIYASSLVTKATKTTQGNATLTAEKGNISIYGGNIANNISAEALETKSISGGFVPYGAQVTASSTRGDVTINNVTVGGEMKAKANNISSTNSTAKNLDMTAIADTSKTVTTTYKYGHLNVATEETKSGGDITLNNVKTTGYYVPSTLTADNNININSGSELSKALVSAGNDINVNYSRLGSSILGAGNDINLNAATISFSGMGANRDINVANGSKVSYSLVGAGRDVNVTSSLASYEEDGPMPMFVSREGKKSSQPKYDMNQSEVSDSTVIAGRDINVKGSKVTNSTAIAFNNINVSAASMEQPEYGEMAFKSKKPQHDAPTLGSTITNSTLNAGRDIKISDSKVVNYHKSFKPDLNAGNDIKIYGSEITNSYAKAGHNITVGASEAKSGKPSKYNMERNFGRDKFDGSTLSNVTLNAGNDISIKDTHSYGNLYATTARGDIRIKDTQAKGNVYANAGDDIVIKDLTVSSIDNKGGRNNYRNNRHSKYESSGNLVATAKGDIKVKNSMIEGNLTAESVATESTKEVRTGENTKEITETTTRGDVTVKNTIVGKDLKVKANNIKVSRAIARNVDLKAIADTKSVVTATKVYNEQVETLVKSKSKIKEPSYTITYSEPVVTTKGGNIKVNQVIATGSKGHLGTATLNADKNISVSNSILGDTNATAGKNINVTNTFVVGNAVATAGGDVNATDLTVLAVKGTVKDAPPNKEMSKAFAEGTGDKVIKSKIKPSTGNLTISAGGDVTLAGVYTGNDLNINKANSVSITNSDSRPMRGVPTIEQLAVGMAPITDYNAARFTSAGYEDIISQYGQNYGAGTRISYIGGNANISGINGNVGIINTAIIGNLNESNIKGDTHLVRSFVGGDYLPGIDTITGDTNVYQSYIKGKFNYRYADSNLLIADEVNRLDYGNPLDTVFRRQFSPRSFAAAEDELKVMKHRTLSSIGASKGKPGTISITKGFFAY